MRRVGREPHEHTRDDAADLPQVALGYEVAEVAAGGVVAVVEVHRGHDPALPRQVAQLAHCRCDRRDRLRREHVSAAFERSPDELRLEPGRDADEHEIQIVSLEQRFDVVDGQSDVVGRGKSLRPLETGAAHGHDLDLRDGCEGG